MICIIPQHGQSNRLPSKALLPLCGLPLVSWAVIQAASAKCIDKVYVSTESMDIARACEPYGAEIIWRPQEIVDKRYSANVPIRHAMKAIGEEALEGPTYHMIAMTPLKKPDDIDRMYQCYRQAPDVPNGLMKAVFLAAKIQEVVVAKEHQPVESRSWGKLFPRGRFVTIDKSHETLAVMGGGGITDAAATLDYHERLGWGLGEHPDQGTDVAVDASDGVVFALYGATIFYYVECEPWQTYEIDDRAGFEMCELLMEHKLLKGRGKEIYDEYAAST